MKSTKIKVTTIGHYHRDKNMKITCDLLPKRFNSNRKYFDNPSLPIPQINLNINVPDSGAGENRMESLLEYIRHKGWHNGQKPDFVTNRQLLNCIVAEDYDAISVEVLRVDDVIFLLKKNETYTYNLAAFGKVFEHFLTKESEDEVIDKDGLVEKAVFVAEIPMEEGTVKVMYSGEINAIDDNDQHYTLKVLNRGLNNYFWGYRSCACYWQCILSNVPIMVIGSRTGELNRDPLTCAPTYLPANSLYKMEVLNVKEIPIKAKTAKISRPRDPRIQAIVENNPASWNIDCCERRLQEFLSLVSNTQNHECYQFSKAKGDLQWTIEKNRWGKSLFCQLVEATVCRASLLSVPAVVT